MVNSPQLSNRYLPTEPGAVSQTRDSGVAERVPVSDGGGFAPRWTGDGKELLYEAENDRVPAP